MKIGIIGAGKVGTSIGKYFVSKGLSLAGYYDVDAGFAGEAAEFTGSAAYEDLEAVAGDSDLLFITVPDSRISSVWDEINQFTLEGKTVCHCSGAMSAYDAFAKPATSRGVHLCSVHPLFAVSDRFSSWDELETSVFALEGDVAGSYVEELFGVLNNPTCVIRSEDKTKYHLAAAVVSNHVVALLDQGISLLEDCGFTEELARQALRPLVRGNVSHVIDCGAVEGLTGPVERCDTDTIRKHLACLSEEDQMLYKLLSKKLVGIAKDKNPERDYEPLEETRK